METTVFTLSSGRAVDVTTFGDADADNVVVLANPEGTEVFDPDPAVTSSRRVRLISVAPPGVSLSDPVVVDVSAVDAANDIAEVLAAREVTRAGAVGWASGGWVALALAATHPGLVSRVAVVSTPAPESDDAEGFSLDDVSAKTLLLFGAGAGAGSRDATWFKKRLTDARVEMNPKPGGREVVARWDRILSHVAPGSKPRRSAD